MQFPGFASKRDGWQVAMLPLNFNDHRTRNDRLTFASVRHRRDFTSSRSFVPRRRKFCFTWTYVIVERRLVIGIKKVELQGKVDPLLRHGYETREGRSNRSQFEEHRPWPV